MFRPKPGKTFTQDEILKIAEDALTKAIARPKLGAWAVMQLVRQGMGLPAEDTPASIPAAEAATTKPAAKRSSKKRTTDVGGV